jgi:YVTN family beta-propeller protein
MRHRRLLLALPVVPVLLAVACGDSGDGDQGGTPPGQTPPGQPPPPEDPNAPSKPLLGPSHGATVSLSENDTRAVMVNTDVGTVSVFAIDYAGADGLPAVTKKGEVPVGAEPVSVVMHPNNAAAYVVVRKDQKVVRVEDLGGTPKKGPEAAVGSEPTGIALEPTGKRLWVTSSVDGTITAIDTATMRVAKTIDLNAVLVASGLLGKDVTPHAALAHPRAIAITNNGDDVDTDETVYVTDLYAQQKAPLAADGSNADTAKVGVLYKIPLDGSEPRIIELPAMADMGFKDYNGNTAGCFPNQITSVVIQGGFGYVSSICASPRGPLSLNMGPAFAACTTEATCPGAVAGTCVSGKCTTNCTSDAQCGFGGKCNANVCAPNAANVRTTTAPVVSIVDLGGNKTIATVNLTKEMDDFYAKIGRPDDATRRYPLTLSDVGFVPGTVNAYFTAAGTDAVFKVEFDATYQASTINNIADPKNPFINLTPAGVDPSRVGKVPTGIAIAHATHTQGSDARFAFVANEATRNLAVIDLQRNEIAGVSGGRPVVASSAPMPTDPAQAAVAEGKRLFITGLGRWSFKGQGWLSCWSCHVDGLSDNVTWSHVRGWRQPPSLGSVYNKKDPSDFRINGWTAIFDEPTDHEGAIRNVAGGVGAIVKDNGLDFSSRLDVPNQGGLNGSSWMAADPKNPGAFPTACAIDDWQKVGAYLKTIRNPRRPSNLDAAKVAQGKDLFMQANCQGCHGGGKWTISRVFYPSDPTATTTTNLKTTSWAAAATNAGFPAALFPAATPSAQTMRYNGATPAALDQLTCALRPVGTFGVAEPEVGVIEVRNDGTPSQGNEPDGKGYNPPSLLGMSLGAPFLHAGQVRTLDALFSDTFSGHHRALAPTFLDAADPARADKVRALVEYVLSIDDDTPTIAIPPLGPNGGDLCAKP